VHPTLSVTDSLQLLRFLLSPLLLTYYWESPISKLNVHHFVYRGMNVSAEVVPSTLELRVTVTSLLRPFFFFFFGSAKRAYFFFIRKVRQYGQRPHSEIPTCIILYNFTPFILPLKTVIFVFLLLIWYVLIGEGGKERSRSRFTENKLFLSQFTGNKIGISRFTKKMAFLDSNLRNSWHLKVTPKHSLVRCLYHPSTFCSGRRKSEEIRARTLSDYCPVTVTQYC